MKPTWFDAVEKHSMSMVGKPAEFLSSELKKSFGPKYQPYKGGLMMRLVPDASGADLSVSQFSLYEDSLARRGLELVKGKRGHLKLRLIRPYHSPQVVSGSLKMPYAIAATTTDVKTAPTISFDEIYKVFSECAEIMAKSPREIEVAPDLFSRIRMLPQQDSEYIPSIHSDNPNRLGTIFGMEVRIDPTLPRDGYRLIYPQPLIRARHNNVILTGVSAE